ncbi:MAG: OmpA family protein [Bacteroidales bacterium]|nr:OmpA family protein [Bacteroidales bacterium]
MKTNLLLALAAGSMLLLSANYAEAQETTVVTETTTDVTLIPVECKTYYNSSWRDNWFIQIGAGMQTPYADKYLENGGAKRHTTAVYNAAFGHWFSPYLAFRVAGYYGKEHFDLGKYQSVHAGSGHIDLMWDMFNSIGGPNTHRFFSIVPFVGIGASYMTTFDSKYATTTTDNGNPKTREWSLPVSVGLQIRARLCQYVDFFAEGRMAFQGDHFNNYVHGAEIESNLYVIGGFTFNLGGKKFTSYNPCDYIDYINGLNKQVNDLRGDLAATAAALAAAEAQLPCPEVVESETVVVQAPLLSVVRFKINSAVISDYEMVNVYNMAEYMKANPSINVLVQGYADKDTGTSSYNMALSQRRAQAVVDALVNKYGIDPNRLAIQANGSDVQPYDVNNWNRIVIFEQP